MTKEQAIEFINDVLTNVWENLDESKIADYYHKDISFQFGKQEVNYQDIEHRLAYVKKHYQSLKNEIHDVLVDGDKITMRFTQQCLSYKDAVHHTYAIIAIYQLKDNKIIRGWACIDPNIDYCED